MSGRVAISSIVLILCFRAEILSFNLLPEILNWREISGAWGGQSNLCVARSKQVHMEWMEATVLFYLPKEKKDVYMYTRSTFLPKAALLPEATLLPGTCPAPPS